MSNNNTIQICFQANVLSQGGVVPIAKKTSLEFPPTKLGSAGIHQALSAELGGFLQNLTIDQRLKDLQPTQLIHANELKNIAKLIEEGNRVADTTVYDDKDSQLIVIRIRKP